MSDSDILIIKGSEVVSLLTGRELDLIEQAQSVYVAHAMGESSLPHSTFLRFPNNSLNRIIALPAYLGGDSQVAGLKWVSSFPGNLAMGLDRASAILVLNSAQTGRPRVFLEGSAISAKRTAASAALAARCLLSEGQTPRLGMIGCGPINFEILRFLTALWPAVKEVAAYDLDPARAMQFKQECRTTLNGLDVEIASDVDAVFRMASLVSFATTALQPYIFDLPKSAPGIVILHISLRDLAPQALLTCDNVVDDVDHLCRAQTSAHLAEQQVGHRDFIRCTLVDIILGRAPARKDAEIATVFSPFGLGILDIALGQLVYQLAIEEGKGTVIESFLPVAGLSH
jgi:N-[(2S)-2-amino-2-carboxyethyl]-L-glutamate dehydrogenase